MKVIWLADLESPHVQRWADALLEQHVDFTILSIPKRRPRLLYSIDLFLIWQKLRRDSVDIVHAHFASSYGVILSFLPKRYRTVISVWGSDVLVAPKQLKLYHFLIKRALLKADIRIANSAYLAKEASKIADCKHRVLPFGIDLEKFPFSQREYVAASGMPFVIGITKRLHRVAGVDILLQAFAITVKALPETKLQLLIIGSGPEEASLRKLAGNLGIEELVIWKGWCDPVSLNRMLVRMHLSVFPSRIEGLGVSTLEAMASGVPALAANTGGLRELVGETETRGGLFPLEVNALAERIIRSVSEYDSLLAKSMQARDYVEQNFDIKNNAKQLMDMYRSIV